MQHTRNATLSSGLPTITEPGDGTLNTVPFRYYNVIRNCGDAVTSFILEDSFGLTGRVATPKEPHMLGIGSILFMANRNSHIWGSGVLSPEAQLPKMDPAKIRAVRGKKTLAHLRSLGYDLPNVPLGDAGILVDSLVKPAATPKYRAAIVPHHSGFTSNRWAAARANEDFCMVDMMDDSLLPVQQIADSDVVISQSLHGLIFAAAFGKPYLWISGHSSETWNFKFLDWFSTCDNPQEGPVMMNVAMEDMLKMAEPRNCLCDKKDLKGAFPYELVDETPQVRGNFNISRVLSPAHVYFSNQEDAASLTPQQFVDSLSRIRVKTFAGSPEPTYLAVSCLGAEHIPSRHELLRGQRYLDENRTAAFLWFDGNHDLHDGTDFELCTETFGEASLQRGTVLLRPDGQMGLNQKFARTSVKAPPA